MSNQGWTTQSYEGHDPAEFSDLPSRKENPAKSRPTLDWVTIPCNQKRCHILTAALKRLQQGHEPLLFIQCCRVSCSGSVKVRVKYSTQVILFLAGTAAVKIKHSITASSRFWEGWCVGSDLLPSLRFSHDEAISRTISSYRRSTKR